MTRRFAMIGAVSGEALSYHGQVLVHDDRAELEFLFQGVGRVVELGGQYPPGDCMSIKDHPDLVSTQWPLKREDFVA